MNKNQLRFNDSGKFKILCFADIHMHDSTTPKAADTLTLMNAALDKLSPDLVVFLGDNIGGWDSMTSEDLLNSFDSIISPVREREIPLAVIFGNHDFQAGLTLEEQLEIFCKYDKCLAVKGTCTHGVGNYNLVIRNSSDTRDVFNLWFFDSGDNITDEAGNTAYNYVRDDQIKWYEDTAESLKIKNRGYSLPALVFQHITVPEEYELLKEVSPVTPFAVKGQCAWRDKYYVIAEPKFTTGYLGEGPCPPDFNNGQFSSWVRTGDVLGAVFGHDHINDFCGTVDGISLMQVRGAGFYAYGDGLNRGVRLITLDEADLSTFTTQTVLYKELTGSKHCESVAGLETLTRKQRKALRSTLAVGGGAAAASVLGITIAAIAKKIRRDK